VGRDQLRADAPAAASASTISVALAARRWLVAFRGLLVQQAE
jgi:hypothetical protein